MSEYYHAKLEMDNFVVSFIAIDKTTRKLVRLFLTPMKELSLNSTEAAYFSDTTSASLFAASIGTNQPKMPEGFQLISHTKAYEKVHVTLKYPRLKEGETEYRVETYCDFALDKCPTSYDAAGNIIDRSITNY